MDWALTTQSIDESIRDREARRRQSSPAARVRLVENSIDRTALDLTPHSALPSKIVVDILSIVAVFADSEDSFSRPRRKPLKEILPGAMTVERERV